MNAIGAVLCMSEIKDEVINGITDILDKIFK